MAKAGIGDVEVLPDARTMLLTNLASKTLMSYNDELQITDAMVGCSNDSGTNDPSDWQVFAIAVKDAQSGYLGAVCTAQTSQDPTDLEAVVLDFTLDAAGVPSTATAIHRIPLDYTRGCAHRFTCLVADNKAADTEGNFRPWSDSFFDRVAFRVRKGEETSRIPLRCSPTSTSSRMGP